MSYNMQHPHSLVTANFAKNKNSESLLLYRVAYTLKDTFPGLVTDLHFQ